MLNESREGSVATLVLSEWEMVVIKMGRHQNVMKKAAKQVEILNFIYYLNFIYIVLILYALNVLSWTCSNA